MVTWTRWMQAWFRTGMLKETEVSRLTGWGRPTKTCLVGLYQSWCGEFLPAPWECFRCRSVQIENQQWKWQKTRYILKMVVKTICVVACSQEPFRETASAAFLLQSEYLFWLPTNNVKAVRTKDEETTYSITIKLLIIVWQNWWQCTVHMFTSTSVLLVSITDHQILSNKLR